MLPAYHPHWLRAEMGGALKAQVGGSDGESGSKTYQGAPSPAKRAPSGALLPPGRIPRRRPSTQLVRPGAYLPLAHAPRCLPASGCRRAPAAQPVWTHRRWRSARRWDTTPDGSARSRAGPRTVPAPRAARTMEAGGQRGRRRRSPGVGSREIGARPPSGGAMARRGMRRRASSEARGSAQRRRFALFSRRLLHKGGGGNDGGTNEPLRSAAACSARGEPGRCSVCKACPPDAEHQQAYGATRSRVDPARDRRQERSNGRSGMRAGEGRTEWTVMVC